MIISEYKLARLYGNNRTVLKEEAQRYSRLYLLFVNHFGENKYPLFFSSPGRIELSGNHTDHNNGLALSAAVNLDTIAAVGKSDNGVVEIVSEGFPESFVVKLNHLEFNEEEQGTSTALIKGIASAFVKAGYSIGGFKAVVSSNVGVGSGLSSSASFEVLIASIFNKLYNHDNVNEMEIAKICQFAENEFFGKPCGLLDQIAIVYGGINAIDFKDAHNPVVTSLDFDFDSTDYTLSIVKTGRSHEDLTEEYAAIPNEMKAVARFFGKETCREISADLLLNNIKNLRNEVSDRAILRAFHFLDENERVRNQAKALQEGNVEKFLTNIKASGSSSVKLLQNIFNPKNPSRQEVNLALTLTERFLADRGVCRVHGGGFGGAILVILQRNMIEEFKKFIEEIFGEDSFVKVSVRSQGVFSFDINS